MDYVALSKPINILQLIDYFDSHLRQKAYYHYGRPIELHENIQLYWLHTLAVADINASCMHMLILNRFYSL